MQQLVPPVGRVENRESASFADPKVAKSAVPLAKGNPMFPLLSRHVMDKIEQHAAVPDCLLVASDLGAWPSVPRSLRSDMIRLMANEA